MSKYSRDEHDEVEAAAMVALAGLLASENPNDREPPADLANRAFDIGEQMLSVRKARLGAKPPYSHE